MKKVIVFGGSGFLGSYVSDELSQRGYEVTIADINKSDYLKKSQNFISVNLQDTEKLKEVLSDKDYIYNFAAIAGIEDANSKPQKTFQTNVMGHLNILECAKDIGKVKRIILASSAYAVSNHGSFYGLSKFTSEKLTEEYSKKFNIEYNVIRYGSLYGERASYNNYIYNLLKDAIVNNKIEYKGNDEDIREYIHAADAAKMSVDIIESKELANQHIILTGTERMKRIELITMIKEILQNNIEVEKSSDQNEGHYKITPYAFQPILAKKLVSNPFIDMGQGLLECIQMIHNELDDSTL